MFGVYDINDLMRGSQLIKTFETYEQAKHYLAFELDFKGGMYSLLNNETGDFEQFQKTFNDLLAIGGGNING